LRNGAPASRQMDQLRTLLPRATGLTLVQQDPRRPARGGCAATAQQLEQTFGIRPAGLRTHRAPLPDRAASFRFTSKKNCPCRKTRVAVVENPCLGRISVPSAGRPHIRWLKTRSSFGPIHKRWAKASFTPPPVGQGTTDYPTSATTERPVHRASS